MECRQREKKSRAEEIFEIIIIAKNFPKLMTDTKPGISENTNLGKKKNDSRKHSWTYQFQTTHTHERMQREILEKSENPTPSYKIPNQCSLKHVKVIKNKRSLRDCHSQEEPGETS